MARSSAVPRTLKLFRDEGYFIDVAEQYNSFSGQRKDLFGFIDCVAVNDNTVVGVQVCGTDFQEHVRKLTMERALPVRIWLKHSTRKCILIGWRKVKAKKGGKLMVFRPRIMEFRLVGDELVSREFNEGESIDEVLEAEWK